MKVGIKLTKGGGEKKREVKMAAVTPEE